MKKSKYIISSLLLVLALAFTFHVYTGNTKEPDKTEVNKFLIYDDAVTTANDSLESNWYDINPTSTQVEMYLTVDDTARIDYYIDYRSAPNETAVTLAVDSIVTVGTALTGKGKGIVLKGYGASGIVNLIPGAGQVRYRAYRNAESETIISHHAWIKQNTVN